MVDQENAVPAVGVSKVTRQIPIQPPSTTTPMDEVLHWLAAVVAEAGQPDVVEVLTTTRQIYVACPNQTLFVRWQTIVGAVTQPTRHDALGTTVSAVTVYPNMWSIMVHAHVGTTQ